MLRDECIHERTERENLKASPTGILKRLAYEHRSDSMSLERILDLRVHERDQSWLRAVGGEARQLAVYHGFVTLLVWVVVDLHSHDHDATPRPAPRRTLRRRRADRRVLELGLPAVAGVGIIGPEHHISQSRYRSQHVEHRVAER
jgi:hypothetical protein